MTADRFVHAEMGGAPGAGPTLRIVVPGRVASNNRTTRNFRGGAVKSQEARLYQTKVASYAIAAVNRADWRWPVCCRVQLVHWNGLIDPDNGFKNVLDALKGLVFPDDRRQFVRGVKFEADVDGGDEYLEIIVIACEPLPEVVRRKCHACLESRLGVKVKPHLCGRCSQRRKKALAA